MRIFRSWPAVVPADRSYVVDDIEKLVITNFKYNDLYDIDDDVLLLEWDIAVDGVELARFVDHANEDRSRVIVAPYRLYGLDGHGYYLPHLWAHTRVLDADADPWKTRPVDDNEPTCDLFGLGMTYLPKVLTSRFSRDYIGRFSDDRFSRWHLRHADHPEVPICWDVHAVHLHYTQNHVLGALIG